MADNHRYTIFKFIRIVWFLIYFKNEWSHDRSTGMIYATSCFPIFYDFLEVFSDAATIEIAE